MPTHTTLSVFSSSQPPSTQLDKRVTSIGGHPLLLFYRSPSIRGRSGQN